MPGGIPMTTDRRGARPPATAAATTRSAKGRLPRGWRISRLAVRPPTNAHATPGRKPLSTVTSTTATRIRFGVHVADHEDGSHCCVQDPDQDGEEETGVADLRSLTGWTATWAPTGGGSSIPIGPARPRSQLVLFHVKLSRRP